MREGRRLRAPVLDVRQRLAAYPGGVPGTEVTLRGIHALCHSAGARLCAETRDLEATARHLGHATLEMTRLYATWSDRQLRETIGRW